MPYSIVLPIVGSVSRTRSPEILPTITSQNGALDSRDRIRDTISYILHNNNKKNELDDDDDVIIIIMTRKDIIQ